MFISKLKRDRLVLVVTIWHHVANTTSDEIWTRRKRHEYLSSAYVYLPCSSSIKKQANMQIQATKIEQIHGSIHQPQRLRDKKVSDLITDKRRLVEVPYTASLADIMNTLMANRITAVAVAAPPGHWIGAGGSMILESDKQTGEVRKHYIGMVTMLDILAQIAGNHVELENVSGSEGDDLDQKMKVPVSSIIGRCLESLSLWPLNCNTSIVDCMEVFSKGIHRALVPADSQMENVAGVELVESASSYRMLTQMDVIKFLKAYKNELKGILSRRVKEIGAVSDIVFGVTNRTKVIDAIKCMNTASLNAVPIVQSSNDTEDHTQLINGKHRMLVGTFSATDLRGCSLSQLKSCMNLSVIEFICSGTPLHEASGLRTSTKELVTCYPESTLGEVVDKAINNHVHRVWVTDEQGLLVGLVSLTDMTRVIRSWMLSEPV
ncbi:SNF1-related protein kinase regulatory subunit gamma-like PV42a [Forsythia ovata]|uniref:SNF1-related protein kinase regulatory subunit gamma-like PV42a n=1 Tax=Forsythia ovata TaxID=205694 RepID=A0ABD1P5Z9_9LAMI